MPNIFICLLAALSMVSALSIDAYLPSFHAIGRDFAISMALVQQSLSIYLFPFAVMTLFHGTLSDSFGRRPVQLVMLLIYTLASLGAACAGSFGCGPSCAAMPTPRVIRASCCWAWRRRWPFAAWPCTSARPRHS